MKLSMMFGYQGSRRSIQRSGSGRAVTSQDVQHRNAVDRATAILRRLDSKGRFDHQTHACEGHANELCAAFRLPAVR
jgi:hypothetical protein